MKRTKRPEVSGVPPEIAERMFRDRRVRAEITKRSHFMFFHFYFAHYVKHPTADIHREMFRLSEDEGVRNLFIVAFRGSAKSSIFTMSYPIWAILGVQRKKFVLILCQTQAQAKQHMMNLRRELESNALLLNDLGPFQEESNEWGSSSLVFANMDARITAVSTEQSIRGLRHNQHRPDLIIGDDLEDLASTKTREGRNKTYEWVTGEVVPAGDVDTRLVIVGNLLHDDSLLMRLRENTEKGRIDGAFRMYPLVEDGRIMWSGKYPDMESVEAERRKAANDFAWQREYMLKIIATDEQIVRPEFIKFSDILPTDGLRGIYMGADLAISEKNSADCTAIVTAYLYGTGQNLKIYIQRNPFNKRVPFPEQAEFIKNKLAFEKMHHHRVKIYIEENGYQKALVQYSDSGRNDVEGVTTGRLDKAARLRLTTPLLKEGRIVFPSDGCEELIDQLLGFGKEKHDDLADAFSMLILKIVENNPINRIGLLLA